MEKKTVIVRGNESVCVYMCVCKGDKSPFLIGIKNI